MKPEPFCIEPTFSPRIWGARSLVPLFPEKTGLSEPVGEAWLTDVSCRIAGGHLKGKTLGQAWNDMGADSRGSNFDQPCDFPLLVKFIFPTDKLSIQVHPDDRYASTYEKTAGGRGKTEMWHVVSAEADASLLLGLKPEVSKESFLAATSDGTLENLFERHSVRPGDTYFVPARIPHTIGPGMVICEVQQYSDITYRVYDYGRVERSGKPRELHLKKALEVIDFGRSLRGQTTPLPLASAAGTKSLLAACEYFATEIWTFDSTVASPSHFTHFDLLVFLSGSGELKSEGSSQSYLPGQCWFIPADLGTFELHPDKETSVLRTYPPNLFNLRQQLYHRNASDEQLANVVFS